MRAGLDFVAAEREANACGHESHTRIWQERFEAELDRQYATLKAERDALLALVRELAEDDGTDGEGYVNEWTEAGCYTRFQNKARALAAQIDGRKA